MHVNTRYRKFEDVPLVELMYLVFTHMPGEGYCRWLRSLLLCLFRALINSLVFWQWTFSWGWDVVHWWQVFPTLPSLINSLVCWRWTFSWGWDVVHWSQVLLMQPSHPLTSPQLQRRPFPRWASWNAGIQQPTLCLASHLSLFSSFSG